MTIRSYLRILLLSVFVIWTWLPGCLSFIPPVQLSRSPFHRNPKDPFIVFSEGPESQASDSKEPPIPSKQPSLSHDNSNHLDSKANPSVIDLERSRGEGNTKVTDHQITGPKLDSHPISRRTFAKEFVALLICGAGAKLWWDSTHQTGNVEEPHIPTITKVSLSGTRTLSSSWGDEKSPASAPAAKRPQPWQNSWIDHSSATKSKQKAAPSSQGKLAPVNITQVTRSTNITMALNVPYGRISVDPKSFTKIHSYNVPTWLPGFLVPPPKIIKHISNSELLRAATIAGTATEMVRTLLLYPLQTIKTRVQSDAHHAKVSQEQRQLPFLMGVGHRITTLGQRIATRFQEGDLYAGLTPAMLVAVPATGLYYGVRDVSRRILFKIPFLTDVERVLGAALAADVISLCVRTPANTLSMRLRNQKKTHAPVGDWLGDSVKRLPSVILTDLPYLFCKILLGRQFLRGGIGMHQYAGFSMISAIVAALLTTPFDVARTRILTDRNVKNTAGNATAAGWSSVIGTMIAITQEDEGGISNLFAGWLERVLYLGVGRAWLDPLYLIAYVGIRDTVLLQWF